MGRLGYGLGRHRMLPSGGSAAPSPAPIAGFARNGSANPRLRAMLASRLGLIHMNGDSTTAGEGSGTAMAGGNYFLRGARPLRPAARLAASLSAAGYPALDQSVVGDNGMNIDGLATLPDYDSRVGGIGRSISSTQWGEAANQSFAGGCVIAPSAPPAMTFAPDVPVDTFEVMLYNTGGTTFTFRIDGAAPASGASVTVPSAGTGMTRQIVKASTAGTHVLAIYGSDSGGAMRSVRAYDSGSPSIGFLVHAARGARSADQAASNGNWMNLEQLAVDGAALNTLNIGINDVDGGVPVTAFAANVQAWVDAAMKAGDVLLLFPHPWVGPSSTVIQTYHDAVKAVAANRGVAFLSLWEHYGSAPSPAIAARTTDGIHPKAEFYAEIAGVMQQAIMAMAG